MSKPLVVATSNRHKVVELAQLLHGLPWHVQSLKDYPEVDPPIEDGDSFESNALKKALYYAAALGVACVADDSGIVVDALNGAPGIYSARYAGDDCSDENNNAKLLAELDSIPASQRTARFVCCAAYADPEGQTHTETGSVEGRIAFTASGKHGFGYDPLFVPEGHNRSFGEFSLADKQEISHRGRAFRKLRDHLESLP